MNHLLLLQLLIYQIPLKMIDYPTVCWKLSALMHFSKASIHCLVLLHYLPTKVRQLLADLVLKQAETEVEGRIEPDPRMKVPMPNFLQSERRFTPSEILIQKLASKYAWTKAKIAQVY